MTGGGPNGASSVLLQYMYTQGMRNANFGYAMAIAMFTLILAIVLAMISKKVSSEKNRGRLMKTVRTRCIRILMILFTVIFCTRFSGT